jgi:hypothetical protein
VRVKVSTATDGAVKVLDVEYPVTALLNVRQPSALFVVVDAAALGGRIAQQFLVRGSRWCR